MSKILNTVNLDHVSTSKHTPYYTILTGIALSSRHSMFSKATLSDFMCIIRIQNCLC